MNIDAVLKRCITGLIIAVSVVVVCTAACSAAPQFLWERSGEHPSPCSNSAVVSDGSSIYILGGNNETEAITSFWQYTPVTGKWQKLPPLPRGRMCHGAIISQGTILLFGGQTGPLSKPSFIRGIDAYDLKGGAWTESGTMPFSRTRFAYAPIQGKLFIFGGIDESNHTLADAEAYDLEKHTWERKKALPSPRNRHSAVPLDNGVLVCGGENEKGLSLRSTCMYLTSEDRWIEKAPMGTPRKNFAAARLGKSVIASGGWDQTQKGRIFISGSEIYDLAHNRWIDTGALQEARDGTRACALKGALYLIGGFDGTFRKSIETGHFATKHSDWKENRELRVQLATYYDDETFLTDSNSAVMKDIDLGNGRGADITNIILKDIRGLGFPLPAREKSEDYTYFLKFYQYPSTLSAPLSVGHCIDSLLLFGTAGGKSLIPLLPREREVVIKKGFIAKIGTVFTAENPYPPQRALLGPTVLNGSTVTPQQYFDSHIPFSSLYVTPLNDSAAANDDEKARQSAGGVVAFHQEILSLYRAAYREVKGPDQSKFYFIDDEPLQYGDGSGCDVTVIRVPAKPGVFTNWKDLVMPNPPKGMFLSGLLLLYKDLYTLSGGTKVKGLMSIDDILKEGVKKDAHVFEVGSVVRVSQR